MAIIEQGNALFMFDEDDEQRVTVTVMDKDKRRALLTFSLTPGEANELCARLKRRSRYVQKRLMEAVDDELPEDGQGPDSSNGATADDNGAEPRLPAGAATATG